MACLGRGGWVVMLRKLDLGEAHVKDAVWLSGLRVWGKGDASRREIHKVDFVTTRDHPTGQANRC